MSINKYLSKLAGIQPMTWWTFVIAMSTVANVVIACLMWNITNKTIKSTNRPFVGVDKITPIIDDAKRQLHINLEIKNFGNIPAKGMSGGWNIFINGEPQQVSKIPDEPGTLFPNSAIFLVASFSKKLYDDIISGKSSLRVVYDMEYYGVSMEKYTTHMISQYYPKAKRFISIESDWK